MKKNQEFDPRQKYINEYRRRNAIKHEADVHDSDAKWSIWLSILPFATSIVMLAIDLCAKDSGKQFYYFLGIKFFVEIFDVVTALVLVAAVILVAAFLLKRAIFGLKSPRFKNLATVAVLLCSSSLAMQVAVLIKMLVYSLSK